MRGGHCSIQVDSEAMRSPKPPTGSIPTGRILRGVVGLGIALLLAACDTPPQVEVRQITCTAIGTSEPQFAQLELDLLLENTTDEPIQLQTFEYTVEVGQSSDRSRWQGSWQALRTLPARTAVPMTLPAVIPNPFLGATSDTRWRMFGTISYKAPGRLAQILFDTGFRLPKHDFQGRGESIAISTQPDEPSEANQDPSP